MNFALDGIITKAIIVRCINVTDRCTFLVFFGILVEPGTN